jgi:aryl-alcohol dehydrogenase-like predicted oxidoreductase
MPDASTSDHYECGLKKMSEVYGVADLVVDQRAAEARAHVAAGLGFPKALLDETDILATAWTLAHPAVHVAIVSARKADHIAAAVDADVHLEKTDPDEIDGVLVDAVPMAGPSSEGG